MSFLHDLEDHLRSLFLIASYAMIALAAFVALRRRSIAGWPSLLLAFGINIGGLWLFDGLAQGYAPRQFILVFLLLGFPVAMMFSVAAARQKDMAARALLIGTALMPALFMFTFANWSALAGEPPDPDYFPNEAVLGLCWACAVGATYVFLSRHWFARRRVLRITLLALVTLLPLIALKLAVVANDLAEKNQREQLRDDIAAQKIAEVRMCSKTLTPALGRRDALDSLGKGDRRLHAAYRIGQEEMSPVVPGLTIIETACSGMCLSDWIEGHPARSDRRQRYALAVAPRPKLPSDPWGKMREYPEWQPLASACERVVIEYLEAYNGTILRAGAKTLPRD